MARARCCVWLLAILCAGCAAPDTSRADILLFNGRGTSPNDVAALEDILRESGLRYSTVSSARLDAITETDLKAYRLLVIPGGNFEFMGNALATSTPAKL